MDDYMPRSKDRSRGELEKLRELSFKEKLWYIWNYYNYYIIGAVVGIAVLVSLMRACYFTPDTALFIAWESPYITDNELIKFEQAISDMILDPDANEVVQSSSFFLVSDNMEVASANSERLVAMLSAGAIDIFIVSSAGLEAFSAAEFLMPLDEILGAIEELDPALYEKIFKETVKAKYGSVRDERTGEYIRASTVEETVGIRITDTPLMRSMEFDLSEDVYLCVAISYSNYYYTHHAIMELFR